MATKELKYQFKVSEDGKEIKIVNRKGFENDMRNLFKGQTVIGVFRKPRKLRSTQQNSYYFGCCVPEVLEGLLEAGFEASSLNIEVVHDMLRHKFLTEDLPSPEFSGEYISITKSTTELTTTEFMSYIDAIQKWSMEFLNHYIPSPSEQKEIYLL